MTLSYQTEMLHSFLIFFYFESSHRKLSTISWPWTEEVLQFVMTLSVEDLVLWARRGKLIHKNATIFLNENSLALRSAWPGPTAKKTWRTLIIYTERQKNIYKANKGKDDMLPGILRVPIHFVCVKWGGELFEQKGELDEMCSLCT